MKLMTNLTIENLLKNDKWVSQFDENQLVMIKEGLKHSYDVSLYATPEFDHFQMRVILYCLYYGFDDFARSLSNTPNFHPDTMMSGVKHLINSSTARCRK